MSNEKHETVADNVSANHHFREVAKMIPHEEVDVSKMETTTPTREKSSVVGNADAMRKALLEASIALSDATHHHMTEDDAKECLSVVNAALSVPPRNCDVGTAEEQSDRFDKFCYSHSKCHKCPVKSIWNSQHRQKQLREIIRCEIIWSQMPYEEVK